MKGSSPHQYLVEGEEDFMEALSLVKASGQISMHVTLLPPEAQDTSGYYGYHCPSCKAPSPDVELRPQRPGLFGGVSPRSHPRLAVHPIRRLKLAASISHRRPR